MSFAAYLTSDQALTVNNTVVDSSMSVSVPAGKHAFTYTGVVNRPTPHGGAVTIRTSQSAVVTRTGSAVMNGVNAVVILNDSSTTTAGNCADIVWDLNVVGAQLEKASGIIDCSVPTTLTVAVYCATAQTITLCKGSSFVLTPVN